MKKQKGFISMAVVYSFFLVFATITTLLLANYAHNRLLIREMNEDIRDELSNVGNNKLARFTNLLANGNTEADTYWYYSINGSASTIVPIPPTSGDPSSSEIPPSTSLVQYNKKNFESEVRSIVLEIPETPSTVLITQTLAEPLTPGHSYYFRCSLFAPWLTSGTSSIIQLRDNDNNSTYQFLNASTFGDFRRWSVTSDILFIPETATTEATWSLELIEIGKVGSPVYLDNFLLIDLTEAVGENLPPLEWLDNYIPFFDGTGIFNRTYNYNGLIDDNEEPTQPES